MWSVPDWRTDEMYVILDNREQGIYRNLIDECWVSGSITSNPELLARFVREPLDYFLTVWGKIEHKFRSLSNGQITSKRLLEDRRRLTTVRQQRHNKAKNAAKVRWNKANNDNEIHATSMSQALLGAPQTQTQTQKNTEEEGFSLKDSPSLKQNSLITHSSPSAPVSTSSRDRNADQSATSPADLFAIYNQNRGQLPEAKALTNERAAKCRARLARNNGSFVSDWTRAIQRAAKSAFCLGDGAQGWKASFDWFIANNTNYVKVLEGKYDKSLKPARLPMPDKPEYHG